MTPPQHLCEQHSHPLRRPARPAYCPDMVPDEAGTSPVPAICDGCGEVVPSATTVNDPGSLTTMTDEYAGACAVCGSSVRVRKGVYRSTPGGGMARRFA